MGEAQRYSAMEMRSHGNRGGKSGGKGGGKRKRDGDGDDEAMDEGTRVEADHELPSACRRHGRRTRDEAARGKKPRK